ncbi:MAG: hypothetical protein ACPGOV_12720 [Magnetovibrionaceae bacterium]
MDIAATATAIIAAKTGQARQDISLQQIKQALDSQQAAAGLASQATEQAKQAADAAAAAAASAAGGVNIKI